MNKNTLPVQEDFQKIYAPRLEELSAAHENRTIKPHEAFANEISKPPTHDVISAAHDAEPVLHNDREW